MDNLARREQGFYIHLRSSVFRGECHLVDLVENRWILNASFVTENSMRSYPKMKLTLVYAFAGSNWRTADRNGEDPSSDPRAES